MAALRQPQVRKYVAIMAGDFQATSKQRKLPSDEVTQRKIPVAALSDSRLVRGMLTAIGWLGVNVQAFKCEDLAGAARWLQISDPTLATLVAVVDELKAAVHRDLALRSIAATQRAG